MSQVITDTIRVRLQWAWQGVPAALNILHYRVPFGITVNQGLADQLGPAIAADHAGSGLPAQQAAGWALDAVGVRDLREANQAEFVAQIDSPGTDTAEPLPPSNALVVTLRTALAGRSFRGRIYLPGWSEGANVSPGRATPAAVTAATNFVAAIRELTVGANTLTLAVARQFSNNAPIEPGTSQPVTAAVVRDNTWDNQRRRSDLSLA